MKISIITVSFNSQKTIEETIQSVLRQTHPDVEYIVIDGGSTDGTLDIIHRYKDKIAYVQSKKDNGIYDAMNQGVSKATGEVVGFLNADDVFFDEHVLSQVAKAFDPKEEKKSNELDGVYADLIYVKEDDLNCIVRYWKSSSFTPGLFAKGWSPAHPTLYLKRHVYKRLGGFDLSFLMGNDIELMMRFMEKEKIRTQYIPSTWVKMRMGGVSNRSIRNVLLQNREVLKAFEKNHIKVNPVLFWIIKIFSRIKQFIRRPVCEHAH